MKIALTGGIGSGKSFVCRLLEKRGIGVYDCDEAAKRLMRTSLAMQRELSEVVGKDVFPNGILDKRALSEFIVASETNVRTVNDIVHPAVARDFLCSGYDWLESAILFDSGFDSRIQFDYVVCVTAPLEVRIERIMTRDGVTREQALGWIGRQMAQEEKLRRSDFEIKNSGQTDLDEQIDNLLQSVNKLR